MASRLLAPFLLAVLSACATVPVDAPRASAEDCAVLMLVAGFIAEPQPTLRLRPMTREPDLPETLDPPERWSPDADPAQQAQIAASRRMRSADHLAIACPLKGPSPFRRFAVGSLMLSNPAWSDDHAFAVVDAAVRLKGRTDFYRVMLSGPPKTGWDIHRLEFDSQPPWTGAKLTRKIKPGGNP